MKKEFGEKTLCECRTHWSALILPAIICFFFLMASIMGIAENSEDRAFYIIFAIISILIFVIPLLRILTNKLVLTDKRIFGKTGIIKTYSLTAPISKIQMVDIKKGLFGRIFGYSDLVIHCITGLYVFKNQTNAEEMQNAIINTIN